MADEMTDEEKEREQYGGYTLAELLTPPTTEHMLDTYLEDKYGVYPVDEKKFKPLFEASNHCCLTNKQSRCMCKEFRLQDAEGPCKCGRYTKKLNDEDFFIKMRIASVKRGNRG